MPLRHPDAATPSDIEMLHDAIQWVTSRSSTNSYVDTLTPEDIPAELTTIFPKISERQPYIHSYNLHVVGHLLDERGCGPWAGEETRPCSVVLLMQRRLHRLGVIARFFIQPTERPGEHELYRQMQWPHGVGLDPPNDIVSETLPNACLPYAEQARGLPSMVLQREAAALIDLLVGPELPRPEPRPGSS